MSHAVDGTYIKAQQDKMVNSSLCKKRQWIHILMLWKLI
ncbi:conserved hypothetical protein [Escherichia coli 1827-70]|nr:conserved hypothetical protein [Escherichia coli 1827-70]